jgi:uncharacterized protein YbjT (DUF2867 family)
LEVFCQKDEGFPNKYGDVNMILIIGGTGKVGSEAVEQLSALEISVRALVRNPDKAASIAAPGVELAQGDLGKPETLIAALKGVEKALLISPPGPNQAKLEGNFLEAAKSSRLQRIVRISALGSKPDSPVYLARGHGEVDKMLEESDIPFTIIRPHFFMQNMFLFEESIREKGVFHTSAEDGKTGMVHVRDIAAVAVTALKEDGHEGQTYVVTGPEAISFNDVAEKLSAALGKKIEHKGISFLEAKQYLLDKGWPEWFADSFVTLFDIYKTGKGGLVTDTVRQVAKVKPHTFDQFAAEFAQKLSR